MNVWMNVKRNGFWETYFWRNFANDGKPIINEKRSFLILTRSSFCFPFFFSSNKNKTWNISKILNISYCAPRFIFSFFSKHYMGCSMPGGLPNKISREKKNRMNIFLNLSAVWRFYFFRSSLFCYIIRSHGPKIKHICIICGH